MTGEVRLVAAGERSPGQETFGMIREEALAIGRMWAGVARTAPGAISGWHHHGDHESAVYVLSGGFRMEFGPGGTEILEAGPGDFMYVGPNAIHRESNPTAIESEIVVVRFGSGEVVVNVDGPER